MDTPETLTATAAEGGVVANARELIALAKATTVNGPIKTDVGTTVYFVSDGNGLKQVTLDPLNRPLPDRIRATETMVEPDSFVDYVNRFKTVTAIAKASLSSGTIVATLDYHAPTFGYPNPTANDVPAPGYAQHTITLKAEYDEDWKAWEKAFGEYMGQADYGRFIENMAHTIGKPDLATLLSVVEAVDIDRSLRVKSTVNRVNNTVSLNVQEVDTAGASTGQPINVVIPSDIALVMPVFAGTAAIQVNAKLRYVVDRGHLKFAIDVPGAQKLKRDEFRKIGDDVGARAGIPVFYSA